MADTPPPTVPPREETPVLASEPTARTEAVPHLQFKAGLLLAFTALLIAGTTLFLLSARGYFEPKQTLVLITDNSEGVAAGMDLTFSGFPIGTVRSVSLGEEGNVRIKIEVIKRDAKWLRTSSVFTLVRSLVGGSQLRAYSGVLSDPPLPEGAERPVLRGDANEELQRVIGTARDLISNLNDMTASGSELNQSLANVKAFTERLQGKQGALHAMLGNEEDARKLVQTIEGANAAMARADRLMGSMDRLVNSADREVFGPNGVTDEARKTLREVQGILTATRGSLQRIDALVQDAQGITSNVKSATDDLGSLRGDVEANLRKVEDMINDLNRKWPFNKEREVQLP